MENAKIEVVVARPEDARIIALLGRITFSETFGHLFRDPSDLLHYCSNTFGLEKISRSLLKKENLFWLGLADGLPVGYAKLKLDVNSDFVKASRVGQLQKIYVLKDFLGYGIGLKLQDTLLSQAAALGCEEVWLSVLNENSRAIRFYEKNGFKIVGHHDYTIGKEHFEFEVMSKALSGES
ncbi:GNAT family N-acetyltransferase [Poritiphilus flavus]|uniref:GNAT family N-acetyltransferase n=1 Tax=Poritiphilus flavus TaxID=2697053 RepID=A0A6L9EEA5_9FLAO|nr:GNAT family N-acetyltransferase [Poritiphilus flavus]NAS13094.1 GNAT family N-acetyltransferase [Poritiphilus flavus]